MGNFNPMNAPPPDSQRIKTLSEPGPTPGVSPDGPQQAREDTKPAVEDGRAQVGGQRAWV